LGQPRGYNRIERRRAGDLMATLAKLLQVDMDLPSMAKRLAAAGRGKDSILAHINPKEMALLKKHGGSGKINPKTGIMEFDDSVDYSSAPDETTAETNRLAADNQAASESQTPTPDYGAQNEAAKAGAMATPDYSAYTPSANFTQPSRSIPATTPYTAPAPAAPAVGPSPAGNYNPNASPSTPVFNPADALSETPEKPGFIDRLTNTLQPYSTSAEKLSKALDPFAPYAKLATQLYGGYQARQQGNQAADQAAKNEAEIRALANPYQQQAQQIGQQGQQLIAAGQAGQLTAAQQQQLQAQRAQIMQQQASSGAGGGTADVQAEAILQQQAAAFAQQNVAQGIALLNQASQIQGVADKYITDAIQTGYQQSADAAKLAQGFYQSLGYSLPESQTKAPNQ